MSRRVKTALQEYRDLNPQVGERVIVAVDKIFGRGKREAEGEIVAIHPDTAEIEVRLGKSTYTQRVGPSRIVARITTTTEVKRRK